METGYINCTKNKWSNILKEVLTSDFFYNESYDKIVYLFSLIECMIQNAKKLRIRLFQSISNWIFYRFEVDTCIKKIAYF